MAFHLIREVYYEKMRGSDFDGNFIIYLIHVFLLVDPNPFATCLFDPGLDRFCQAYVIESSNHIAIKASEDFVAVCSNSASQTQP